MPKFLCLGYLNAATMSATPKEEIDAAMAKCWPHMRDFYAAGQVLVDAGLGLTTKLVRRESGKVRVTDGPFTEAKEIVGSAFLVEAADMEDAVRVATLHPAVQIAEGEHLGWRLEVRPVDYYGPPVSQA